MKKLSYILVIVMFMQMITLNIHAAETDLIIPVSSDDKNILTTENFESGQLQGWSWWDSQNASVQIVKDEEDTQNPTNVLNLVEYSYFQESWMFDNFILEYNYKHNKYGDAFPATLLRNGNDKLNIYISGGSTLCVEGSGGSWIGSADFNFSEFDGQWIYVRIELTDGRIKYYVNSTDDPILDIETSDASKSYNIGFVGGGYVDNLMISTPAREVPEVEIDREHNDILAEDTLSEENQALWSCVSGVPVFSADEDGTPIYEVQGKDTFNNDYFSLLRNYTIEFNLKIDYKNEAGVLGKSWPGLDFRVNGDDYYSLYFSSSGEGQIEVERRLNDETDDWMGASASCGVLEQQDRWAYLKIEIKGDLVNIYYMDKDTPCISFTETKEGAPAYGGFRFIRNSSSKYYIKNLVVYTQKPEQTPSVLPEEDENNKVILKEDFSSTNSVFDGGELSDGALDFSEKITSLESYDNFTLEFNMKNDYIPFGDKIGHIYFRMQNGSGYDLQLDTKPSQNRIVLKRGFRTLGSAYPKLMDRNNEWDYFKIEAEGDNIRVYYNDKNTPIMEVVDVGGNKFGSIQIEPVGKTSLDNVLISVPSTGKKVNILNASFEEGETVRFTGEAESEYEEDVNGILVIAAFDEQDKLVDINAADIIVKANTVIPLDITVKAGESYEVYMLRSGKTMNVLADSVVYNKEKPQIISAGKASDAVLSVNVQMEDAVLTVDGELGDGIRKSVFIIAKKADSAGDSFSCMAFNSEDIAAISQIDTVSDSGKFNKVLTFSDKALEGGYVVYIASVDGILMTEKETTYISQKKLEEFIEKLGTLSGQDIYTLLTDKQNEIYMQRIGIDTEKYYSIKDSALMLTVCNNFALKRPENQQDYANVFNSEIRLPYLKDSASAEVVKQRIDGDLEFFGFDEDAAAEYSGLEDSIRLEVCDGIYRDKSSYKDMEDVSYGLKMNVVLAQIYLANYTMINDLLEKYEDKLGIDLSKTEDIKASKLDSFYKSLNEKRCYNYEDFIKVYNNAYEEVTSSNNGGGSGGSGGGGGSSVGDSGGFAAPPLQTVPENVPVDESTKLFADMDENHWAYEAVAYMKDKGIIAGFEDGSFLPDDEMTREQFIKVIVSAFDIDLNSDGLNFSDVSESDWSYQYIKAASGLGIINGVTNELFMPKDYITRQDACAVIYRLLTQQGITLDSSAMSKFNDYDEISDYAKQSVSYLADCGVIAGVSEGEFAPKSYVTRAAVARIIYGVLQKANLM